MPSRGGFQFGDGAHRLALGCISADIGVLGIEGEIRAFDHDDGANRVGTIAHRQRAWHVRSWDSGAHVQTTSAVAAAP